LKTRAGQQERANNTRTFLAVDGLRVIGYYATTTYRLGLDEVAEMYGVGKRTYPIPAVLLARLAVDTGFQGCGIGPKLLLHALSQIAEASRHVGFEVVVVHAIDRDAVTFYAQRGFTSQRLFPSSGLSSNASVRTARPSEGSVGASRARVHRCAGRAAWAQRRTTLKDQAELRPDTEKR
jgi:GNAT superfamily N-acetyltransferase